jgi:predicted small lipoprotein YifL
MVREFGRAFQVIRASNATLARIAVVGALVAALGLAGCGRKTGLDPPPAAAVPAAPQHAAGGQPGTEAGVDADGKPVAAPGRRRSIFLDWLID